MFSVVSYIWRVYLSLFSFLYFVFWLYHRLPLSQRFFLIFLCERDQEQAAKRATTSCESDEEREKNLWLPWPRISLSCRRQGQDLTLGRWLVDIFSNTQTNLIGSFYCNYRGDAEDFYTLFLKVNFASLYQGINTRNNISTGPGTFSLPASSWRSTDSSI